MKKILTLLIAVTVIFGLTACSGSPAPAEEQDGTKTASNEASQEGGDKTAGEGLNIAIVTTPATVDDGSFNENVYDGILAFIKEHPEAKVTAVNEPSGDPATAVKATADIVADYDVIVGSGFQFSGLGAVAADNPDKKFIIVDAFPTDENGAEVELPNVYAMKFAEQESGFYAGMAAALESKTKKVAAVCGIAFPPVVNFQYGFESGVNYANKKYNTGVEIVELPSYAGTDVTGADVKGNYIGSFEDQAAAKVIGNALLKENCDIIFVIAGGAGYGVQTAVKENGEAMVIGVDVDQYDDGVNGDKNIILTSALKIMDMNVHKQLNKIADSTFEGKNETLTATEDSTGYVKKEGRHQLSPETIEKIEAAYALVKDGTIVPASNFNGIKSDSFPGLDQ